MTIFIFLPGVFFLQVSQSVFTLTPGVKICLQSFRVPLFLPAVKGFGFSVPRSSLLTSSHSSLSPLLPGGILLLPNLFPLELLILNRTLSLFALIEDFPFSADSFCSALSWHWIILLPNSDHKKLFFTAMASKVEAFSWRRTGGAARRWEGAGEAAVPAWDRGKKQLCPLCTYLGRDGAYSLGSLALAVVTHLRVLSSSQLLLPVHSPFSSPLFSPYFAFSSSACLLGLFKHVQ